MVFFPMSFLWFPYDFPKNVYRILFSAKGVPPTPQHSDAHPFTSFPMSRVRIHCGDCHSHAGNIERNYRTLHSPIDCLFSDRYYQIASKPQADENVGVCGGRSNTHVNWVPGTTRVCPAGKLSLYIFWHPTSVREQLMDQYAQQSVSAVCIKPALWSYLR